MFFRIPQPSFSGLYYFSFQSGPFFISYYDLRTTLPGNILTATDLLSLCSHVESLIQRRRKNKTRVRLFSPLFLLSNMEAAPLKSYEDSAHDQYLFYDNTHDDYAAQCLDIYVRNRSLGMGHCDCLEQATDQWDKAAGVCLSIKAMVLNVSF